MTKKQARKKTRALIRDCAADMRRNLEKALSSGAINLSEYEENWLLPKTILLALLKEQYREFSPDFSGTMGRQVKKESENIYRHI